MTTKFSSRDKVNQKCIKAIEIFFFLLYPALAVLGSWPKV